jgi:cell division protein ZapA
MAQLTVKINGYAYTVACEDGQEAHLQEMARQVEQRIEALKALSGASGEGRMLVLAALLMADELHDTAIDLANLRQQLSGGVIEAASSAKAETRDTTTNTKRIAKLARKAEDIAASIEQP